jgi:hypothetical protein
VAPGVIAPLAMKSHDGRSEDLNQVITHYSRVLKLSLSDGEKTDHPILEVTVGGTGRQDPDAAPTGRGRGAVNTWEICFDASPA